MMREVTLIRNTAKAALESFTGCTVKSSDLTLLEDNGERTYIRFRVKDIEYVFNSYVCDEFIDEKGIEHKCIWVGEDTITRVGRR